MSSAMQYGTRFFWGHNLQYTSTLLIGSENSMAVKLLFLK